MFELRGRPETDLRFGLVFISVLGLGLDTDSNGCFGEWEVVGLIAALDLSLVESLRTLLRWFEDKREIDSSFVK